MSFSFSLRKFSFLNSRHFTHRIFCFVLGVFVGLQMYGTFWHEGQTDQDKGTTTSSPFSPFRYFYKLAKSDTTPSQLHRLSDAEILDLNITLDKEKALKTLLRLNAEQKIRNWNKFPLHFRNSSVVILIQVHRRKADLGMMIESLRSVRYINETLVIFSHDYFARDVFQLVQSIDFCPVLQLFYPYAIQFYDKVFPGDSPNDCTRDVGKDEALKRGCYNAKYPDSYGHYREGKFTQIKHHWVWKQHFLFDRVRHLQDFNGTVLRLDDDYYLAEDIIHVIRTLDDVRPVTCPTCLMYIMGEHEKLKPTTYVTDCDKAIVSNYFTGIGRGMAFKRDFWNVFKKCASEFCKFDDYNWDWALEHAAASCRQGIKILKPLAGRIFHIGTCQGFHRNIKNCDKKKIKADVYSVLSKYRNNLYPKTFQVSQSGAKVRTLKGFGGWSDPRDMEVCMRFVSNGTEGRQSLDEINKMLSV